jgi:hypothetical protein
MSNYVTIANLAAIKMGTQARISAPNDDTVLARKIAQIWDIERRATIREGAWNFAMRREGVAAAAGAVPYPWQSAFPLPATALRLIEVLNREVGSDFQLEGRAVLCDTAGPLYLRFLIDVPEPAEWDESFAEAFACRLAWKAGKSICGSTYSEDQGAADYAQAMGKAKSTDSLENPRIEQEEVGWVTARFGAGEAPWGR